MKIRNKWELLLIPVLAFAVYFIYQAVQVGDLPPDPDAEYHQALLFIQQNKLNEAKGLLEEGKQKHPQEGKYDFQLGNIARKQNRIADALQLYQESIKSSPALVEAYNNIAGLQMQENMLSDALQTIDAGIKQDAAFKDLHFKKGQVLFVQASYAQAIEELLPLVGNAEYPEAARFAGLSLAKVNRPAEALPLLKEYLSKAKPDAPGLADIQVMIKQMESK
jgi:tetratricopeptide (TPR) repeat protein